MNVRQEVVLQLPKPTYAAGLFETRYAEFSPGGKRAREYRHGDSKRREANVEKKIWGKFTPGAWTKNPGPAVDDIPVNIFQLPFWVFSSHPPQEAPRQCVSTSSEK